MNSASWKSFLSLPAVQLQIIIDKVCQNIILKRKMARVKSQTLAEDQSKSFISYSSNPWSQPTELTTVNDFLSMNPKISLLMGTYIPFSERKGDHIMFHLR